MTGFDWHLSNWMLWCRGRSWLPKGHVSQVAVLMQQAEQDGRATTDPKPVIFEEHALAFNGLIMKLPRRLFDVFLLNHLDKGIHGQIIVYTRHPGLKYQLAGMSKSTFYERAKEADNMIKRWMA